MRRSSKIIFAASAVLLVGVVTTAATVVLWRRNATWHMCEVGNYNACTSLIEHGNETTTNLSTAYLFRGMLMADRGKHAQAIADYNVALKLMPMRAEVLNNRAVSYLHIGDNKNALKDLNLALKAKPMLGTSYCNRAILMHAYGDLPSSKADYITAAEVGADDKCMNYLRQLFN